MSKTRKPVDRPQLPVARDSSTGQFLAAAERMKRANTASPKVARAKLKELGILGADGKLSKHYK
jgi:hypothetical protein